MTSLFTSKTKALLALFAVLLALNLLPSSRAELGAELPALAVIEKDAATRIEISRGLTDKLVLAKEDGSWVVKQPFTGPADAVSIRSLLTVFSEPVPMDLKVDEGNLETYLLDDQKAMVLEIFTSADTPAISLVVGGDAPGGTSFVRLRDSEVVYRAKVGSRARLERPFEDWQNRMVVQEDAGAVTDLMVERGGERLRFSRAPTGEVDEKGNPQMGLWTLVDAPDFIPDQQTLNDMVASFTTLRAGRLLSADFDGGFAEPAAVITLGFGEARAITLRIGSREGEDGAYLRRDDLAGAYVVSPARKAAALRPLSAYRDLEIFAFDRTDIDTVRLVDGQVPTTLRQLPDGLWEVTEPTRVDADVKLILFAVNTLATLRGDRVAEPGEPTGLDKPTQTFTVRFKSGETEVLEVGTTSSNSEGQLFYAVRRAGSDRVYWVRDSTLTRVRQGFNRAG